jgi:pimeloyl-ACP methyl ester carboxylesterase
METTLHPPKGLSLLRAEHTIQRVSIDGLDWEYIDAGKGSLPLILLPGAMGTSETFYKQILGFKGSQRIISVNYPAVTDPALITEGLASLIEALGLQKINLFGTSLGGYIAQRFAGLRSDLVSRVMIANSFVRSDRILKSDAFNPLRAHQLTDDAIQAYWRTRITQGTSTNGPSELAGVQFDFLSTPGYARQLRMRLLTLENCKQPPAPIKSNAVIMDCEDDSIIDPETSLEVRHCHRSARIYSLSHGGHYPYINNSHNFNEILQNEFFAD